ncbi:hypothetical protein [Corynebacterium cystitidis]|uniref:DUF3558 domain-containing protein n=1 Tax=Corynebacterium cystitidis DSM 20524 TaxID=1121357 RepID=A0A1H9W344_9CORY|nr:hypothetical protein [Corynebacterium cystitidis]WJY83014.1 hypothetical protein CCYS_10525 [Corynebacterium cystitidis DSM 20524]SES28278.1 hypothetical protein SAMN05661109_02519 [Corynebacterium cystitidis DSM 20524]SNV64912.1 Uncharacterised protein [Corynebacterium cystitidis]
MRARKKSRAACVLVGTGLTLVGCSSEAASERPVAVGASWVAHPEHVGSDYLPPGEDCESFPVVVPDSGWSEAGVSFVSTAGWCVPGWPSSQPYAALVAGAVWVPAVEAGAISPAEAALLASAPVLPRALRYGQDPYGTACGDVVFAIHHETGDVALDGTLHAAYARDLEEILARAVPHSPAESLCLSGGGGDA